MERLVTSTLKKRKSRALGFRLLLCYLKQKHIILEENVHVWMSILVQSCNLSELRLYGDLIFSSMALLIDRIQSDGILSKAFLSTYLFKVLDCLCLNEIYENERQTLAALHLIKCCLKYYPKGIKSKKSSVEKLLISLIDNRNVDVIHQTGECWLLLQNVQGNCSNENVCNKTVWRDFQLLLLNNLQQLINNKLMISEENIESPSEPHIFGLFPFVVKDPFEMVSQAFRRILNLIEYLKITLREQFVYKKYICTHQILGLIHNGLQVNAHQRNNLRVDHAYFVTFLPEMHIKLLELLEILIKICYTHLRMDFRIVLNILVDALERTKSMRPAENRNQVINIRLIVYRVIALWCSTLQEGSHCEIISETLIKEILDDLVPRNKTSLICRGESNLKTKCSPKSIVSMLEMSFNNEDNNMLQYQAHFCLQQLLSSSGHLLSKQLLKDVHNTLLGICILIHSEPTKIPSLRNIWNCRLEVYKSFAVLLKSRNYGCPAPSEIIMTLLNESQLFENSTELRKSWTIKAIELMLHPHKTGIQFKQGDENLKFLPFCHLDKSNLKSSKHLALIDIAQPNINDRNKTVNQNIKENEILQTSDDAGNPPYSKNDNSNEISYNIINNNVYNENIIGFIDNSLNREKYFKEKNKNPLKEVTAEFSVQNLKESKECFHSVKTDTPERFDKRTDLALSNGNVKQSEPILQMDSRKLDDAKMVADLEAIFVGELK